MAVELVYETHALSVDNERGVATGWLDGELSEYGRRLAVELGERRRDVAAVYDSDLGRAVETAEIAFGGTPMPVHRDARLRECDYGQLNGVSVEAVTAVRGEHVDVPFPGGESYRQVVDRMRSFLGDLAAEHDGQRILAIAHSANRWALDHLVGGLSLEELVDEPFAWQEGWLYLVNASSSASDIV